MFLLAGAALESAERALFAAGFETVILRADSLNRESFIEVFELLYSAGFVILADAAGLDADTKHKVQLGDAERRVFDLSGDKEEASGSELVSRVLTHAHSLRSVSSTEKGI
jgi:hypothetical protein